MKNYRIAVIAGDGIGPEVMSECRKVLEAAAGTVLVQMVDGHDLALIDKEISHIFFS